MACATLIAVLDLAFPIITRMFMKDFIPNRNLQAVALWVAALVGLYLARWLCQYIVDFWGHVVGVNMEYHMRKDLFSHLQTLDFQFFDNTKVGHLMSRIVNDLREVTELAHHGPEDLFIASVMLIGSFVYLMSINVPLTLLVFAFIPIIVWYAYGRRSKMESAFTEERKRVADVNAEVENSLLGIRVVKSFVNEDYEQVRFDKANDEFKVARRGAFQGWLSTAQLSFFTNLLNDGPGAGAWFMHEGRIDLADLTAYLMFINYFLQPIRRLISFTQQYQQGMTGFARFVELMEVKPSITDRPGAVAPTKLRGDIVLKMSFRDTSEEVLKVFPCPYLLEQQRHLSAWWRKTTLCHPIPFLM